MPKTLSCVDLIPRIVSRVTPAGARNEFAEPGDWKPKSRLSRPHLETGRLAFECAKIPAMPRPIPTRLSGNFLCGPPPPPAG